MLITQRIKQINVKFNCISIIGCFCRAFNKHNTPHRNIDVPATVTLFIIHTDKTEIDYFPLLKATRL